MTFNRQTSYVFIGLIIVAVLLYIFVGNGPSSITGRWRSIDVPSTRLKWRTEIVFGPHNSGTLTIYPPSGPITEQITYTVKGNTLTLMIISEGTEPEKKAFMSVPAFSPYNVFYVKVAGDVLELKQVDTDDLLFCRVDS